jgi:site-specific recombinase XerC
METDLMHQLVSLMLPCPDELQLETVAVDTQQQQVTVEVIARQTCPACPYCHIHYLVCLQTERGWKAASAHAAARAIRAFSNFLVADGVLDVSPMARVRMAKVDR